jgi:ParB family transcriptional regulator, chromosome partitioning protein
MRLTAGVPPQELRLIPVDRITVLNPRERNVHTFDSIVENIRTIGLKKPITVTTRPSDDGAESYLLICGQGRLNAFRKLGESRIPALVVDVSDEDGFIMSLAENIARRRYRPLELLAGIAQLEAQGCSTHEIAQRTGLSGQYVRDILMLLSRGEDRLLIAVEREQISLHCAIKIVGAGDDDGAVQAALQEAYETGQLRGRQLEDARRLIQLRQQYGRSAARQPASQPPGITTSSLVRAYQKEVQRQRLMIRKSSMAQQRLLFVVSALRQLFDDENFATLLRAEGLDSLPTYLAERVRSGT